MKKIVGALALLILLPSCERNHMPYVSQIRYEAELITAGSVVDFSVFASDEDDDPLTYKWEASHGEFLSPDGSESDLKGFTNTSGLFRISYVPHGSRTVIVRKEHDEDAWYRELRQDVEFTETEQELDLVLTKEALIVEFTDPRDQQVYSFRKIGDYTWMTENLAYLPQVSHPSEQSETEPVYYVYDHYEGDADAAKRKSTFQQYGVLYNWVAAKQACPPGWRLPGNFEYIELSSLFGDKAGLKMKSQSGWYESGNGDNSSGFSAIPGGSLGNGAGFGEITRTAAFHTASADLQGNINYFQLNYDSNSLDNAWGSKRGGFSVRCVRVE